MVTQQGGVPQQQYPMGPPPYPPQYSYPPGPPPPPRQNLVRNVLIGIIAVLVLAVGIGAGVMLGRNGSKSPTTQTHSSQPVTAPSQPATNPAAPPATHPATKVPMSAAAIGQALVGKTSSGGYTVSSVKVLGAPWMKNGVEVAELNVGFTDGSVDHMHFVLDPNSGNWHVHDEFPISSLDSTAGLNDPFPAREATVAGANGNE